MLILIGLVVVFMRRSSTGPGSGPTPGATGPGVPGAYPAGPAPGGPAGY